MPLITDITNPAELTGYAREALSAYEAKKGTLAQFLPNRQVDDIIVRFIAGQAGLVDEARFRAYGAAPEVGTAPQGKRVVLELPAIGQNEPIDEYTKLRARNADDERIVGHITGTVDRVVQAVADRLERMRGTVLVTGKATIDQKNFKSEDDFGRSPDMSVTTNDAWNTPGAKVLDDLLTWRDKYADKNGEEPGVILVSTRVLRLITNAKEFQTKLVDGSTRPASLNDVNAILAGQGLPWIQLYDRRTKAGAVLPADRLLMLPTPVGPEEWQSTQLGATYWGLTESATKPGWEIAESEQPGIAVAAFEGEKPGEPTEVISDAIALPVLANADLSMVAKVA